MTSISGKDTGGKVVAADVKALTFDVFGTVVDWRSSITRNMTAFFAPRGIEADWEAFALAWRGLYQPSMEAVRSGARAYVTLDVLHRENLEEVLSRFSISGLSEAELDELTLAWHRLDPWPDVLPGLERLHRKFKLGSLSNGNIALMEDLARYAGLPWDVILGAEPAQNYKPMPVTYLTSARILGLAPEECMMVAAHNDDLEAARPLGFRTAYVNRPREYGPAQSDNLKAEDGWDVICESFEELADALGC